MLRQTRFFTVAWNAALWVIALAWSTNAAATPTAWAVARDPKVSAERPMKEAAEAELIADRLARRNVLEDPILRIESHAPKAAQLLERGNAAHSTDWEVRDFLGKAYQTTRKWAEAVVVLESVIRDPRTPPPVVEDALADVAIAYARLDRQDDEIEAYETALALDPFPSTRALMLSNQAEAFMTKGDTSRSIAGYHAALESITNVEAISLAPTTLWSLGVALDRSGDLEGGLLSIERARSYDPNDLRIHDDGWFFVPDYDGDYYAALGEWLVARRHADTDMRLEAYDRSILAWKQYLGRAPATNPYVPVARARLRLIEKELDAFAATASLSDPGASRKPKKTSPKKASLNAAEPKSKPTRKGNVKGHQ